MSEILNYIKNNPQETQRLVGVKYEQLEQLIKQALTLHTQKQQESEAKKIRIINKGGGRKVKLSTEEQILLTLVYLRQLTTFQLLGIQFGVSESTANATFNYWLPRDRFCNKADDPYLNSLLVAGDVGVVEGRPLYYEKLLPLLQELLPSSLLEQVKKNASDYEIVLEILTDYELIVDSEEQPRERPGEYKEPKKYYSGKKKNHTFKNQIIVLPSGQDIVDVIAGELGPKSDITLFRQGQKGFDPNQKFQGDKGYIGEPSIKTPTKKPNKGELTLAQKEKNLEMAADRIVVEHVIRLVKIFRIASERFRLNPWKYEQIIMTICGIVRLRIGALVLPI